MPTQITALAVGESYDDRVVLDAVTCSFAAGERTGIVGENGSGKTTLLRLLAGPEVLLPDGPTNHLSPALVEVLEAPPWRATTARSSWSATTAGCGSGGRAPTSS